MRQVAASWRAMVQRLKKERLVLYYAYRDPRVPWYARLVAALVVGYAFSPIDLIPDFIPVLGLLDDALLLPLGLWLALHLIPAQVLADARAEATKHLAENRPVSRVGAVLIVGLWLVSLLLAGWWLSNQMTVR